MNTADHHTKMKAALSRQEGQAVRAHVKDQLRAIHPKLQQPTNRAQREASRHNPELLKPEWHREITKHLFEAVLPHCRRGSDAFIKGRDNGYFLGGLLRDQQVAAEQENLSNKSEYLRQLEEDIETCKAEKKECMAALPAEQRRDFGRGFARGMEWAHCQPASVNMTEVAYRLWNRLPAILTRCGTIPKLFEWLYGRPARDDRGFPAFQKLCQRLGIKLRPPGRPRKF